LQQVRLSEDFENKENVIKAKALHDLEERSYNNISDVTIAAGLVHNVKLPSL
jgi:AICAR transformylase/IMP cyclohydrolase PurH